MLSLVMVLVSADPPAPRVGEPGPVFEALFADGSPYDAAQVKGKVLLMTWWSADDEATRKHFVMMRDLRKEFASEKRLQMMSIRLDGKWDDWIRFQDKQPPHDPKYPLQPFYSDFKWWQAFHAPTTEVRRNPFRIGKAPAAFLIGPDGKLASSNVPDAKLRAEVKAALAKK